MPSYATLTIIIAWRQLILLAVAASCNGLRSMVIVDRWWLANYRFSHLFIDRALNLWAWKNVKSLVAFIRNRPSVLVIQVKAAYTKCLLVILLILVPDLIKCVALRICIVFLLISGMLFVIHTLQQIIIESELSRISLEKCSIRWPAI